jgi:hypothetical protein
MSVTIINLIIQLIAGAIGGNAAGAAAKNVSLGPAETQSPARSAASPAGRS